MSHTLDSKLADVAKWWDEHKRDGMSLEQEVKFLRRLIENLFDVLALMSNDLRDLEGRPRENLGRALYQPGQMSVRGDLRKFG